jgi:glycosyltransferase involved in cell wall biosynthesis
MKTVLFLNPAGYIGGAEKSLLDLAERLPGAGYRPLIVPLGPGPLEEETRRRGIEACGVHLPRSLLWATRKSLLPTLGALLVIPLVLPRALFRLRAIVRARGARIVHTNGLKAHLIGCALKALSGSSLVWHFRDLPAGGARRLFRFLAGIFPDRIIANSRAVKAALGDLEKISVVYNGIAAGAFSSAAGRSKLRREFGVGEKEILVGTVGHFAPLKGQEEFVRAAGRVLVAAPATRFILAGGAIYPAWRGYRETILSLISELGLAGRVTCIGPRDDLPGLLAALDVFVLPSRSEGFGRGNLEAMAAGLPVVSTTVGGVPEVVRDGDTGLLVPPRDPAALAAAILRLARDEGLRHRLGAAGRERAALFSVEKMVEGVIGVYRSLEAAERPGKH